jgi:hypothetical protein
MNYRELELNKLYPRFSICQKYTPNFLLELKKYIDYELNDNIKINELNIFVYKYESIKKIYEHIKNNIVVKRFQFDNLIKIIDEFNKPLKERNNSEIKIWTYNLKFNKHEDIDYELNITKTNIETSIKNNILNKIDESYDEEIKKNTVTKIVQSTKKIGLENPNYALQLSDDHALNISIGTTIAKRANNPNLSNEKILWNLNFDLDQFFDIYQTFGYINFIFSFFILKNVRKEISPYTSNISCANSVSCALSQKKESKRQITSQSSLFEHPKPKPH